MSEFDSRMEIELVKKDVTLLTSLFSKFDTTLDKLQEIAQSLSKMISLQELRMDAQETASKEIFNILEVRRMDHTSDIKEINGRVDRIYNDLTGKIDETEEKILKELKELKEELKKEKESLSSRLTSIEILKYMGTGVVGFAFAALAFATDFMGLFK